MQSKLIAQCKANDRKAQLQLYKQYCNGMFCVAMRFLRNEDDAEDVLQDAFIKAFQCLHQFKGEVTFGAWLKRIVVNRCLDFLREKKIAQVALDETYMQMEEEEDWDLVPDCTVEQVEKQIDALPPKYGFVVRLYLVEGYDHAEIAEILDISESASRTRLLRGKSKLKELLNKVKHWNGY